MTGCCSDAEHELSTMSITLQYLKLCVDVMSGGPVQPEVSIDCSVM